MLVPEAWLHAAGPFARISQLNKDMISFLLQPVLQTWATHHIQKRDFPAITT